MSVGPAHMPQPETTARLVGGGLFLYLAISSLVNLATWTLLLLPNFLHQNGWSGQGIGWAMGTYFSVNLVSQIVAGEIADRRGSVKTALGGVGLGIVAGILYVMAGWSTWLIIPARMFHGAGAGLISSGALIQLTQSVPIERKGQVIGYFGLPGFIMIGIGPLLAEWLVYAWGFQISFLLILIAFALNGWLLLRLPQSLTEGSRSRTPFHVILKASFVRLEGILIFSIFFGLCFSCWNGFLAPTVRGLGTGAVSSFGTGYALGAVVTRLGLSHAIGTHRRRLIAISSLFAYGAGLIMIPHAYSGWNLLAIGIVCGMGHGIYYPSLSSLAAERFHPLYPGQGMSLYVSASGLGHFMGPPIWGALADRFGYSLIFLLAGLLLALATAVFVVAEKR